MLKRSKWLMMAIILLIAVPAAAQEIRVGWLYDVNEESNILGYRIYDKDAQVVVVDAILPSSRTATLYADVTTTWYMVAYNNYVESAPSTDLTWDPDFVAPPTGFVRKPLFTDFRIINQVERLATIHDLRLEAFKARWSRGNPQ